MVRFNSRLWVQNQGNSARPVVCLIVQVLSGVLCSHMAASREHPRPVRCFAGMEQFGIDAEELSSALQKRFQGGASVAKLPGKTETGKEVSLQVLSSNGMLRGVLCREMHYGCIRR